ncbi:hypothetical protein, partial [Cognatishimia sp.]|uniref:hypothetical protein n=1 Tax=Cognatishimia sp. TaxID=2211648 RepID=UPI003516F153
WATSIICKTTIHYVIVKIEVLAVMTDCKERSTAAQAPSDLSHFFSIADVRACSTKANYSAPRNHKNQ